MTSTSFGEEVDAEEEFRGRIPNEACTGQNVAEERHGQWV